MRMRLLSLHTVRIMSWLVQVKFPSEILYLSFIWVSASFTYRGLGSCAAFRLGGSLQQVFRVLHGVRQYTGIHCH